MKKKNNQEFKDDLIDALYEEKKFRTLEPIKITINNLGKKIAKDNDLTIQKLSDEIGRCNSSLGFSLRNGTLTVKDLNKMFNVIDQNLIVVYNDEKYELQF